MEQKMSAKQFWIRFAIWATLALAIPLAFVAWRFGIFSNREGHSLSGWGVVAIALLSFFFIYVIELAKQGMPKGSMANQCLDGLKIVIPLILSLFLLRSIKNSIEQFESFIAVLIICESAAIPVNPMPKWAAQNHIDTAKKNIIEIAREAAKAIKQDGGE